VRGAKGYRRHSSNRSTSGHSEEVWLGEGIPHRRLKCGATHREAGAHDETERDSWKADGAHDRIGLLTSTTRDCAPDLGERKVDGTNGQCRDYRGDQRNEKCDPTAQTHLLLRF
jgi:hypothetical protein